MSKPELLDTPEAAQFLCVSPGTLAVWRCTARYNLPYIKVGRKVKYDKNDLISFIEARKVQLVDEEVDKAEKEMRECIDSFIGEN